MAPQVQLTGSLQFNTGRVGDALETFLLNLAALVGTTFEGPIQASLASGANVITLPLTTVQFVYVKNLHATNTILVTWTPQGGASASIMTLRPGDWILCSASPGSGSGITALGLNASGASTPAEYILFG